MFYLYHSKFFFEFLVKNTFLFLWKKKKKILKNNKIEISQLKKKLKEKEKEIFLFEKKIFIEEKVKEIFI